MNQSLKDIKWHFICSNEKSSLTKDIVITSQGKLVGMKRKKNKYRNLLGCVYNAKLQYLQSVIMIHNNIKEETRKINDSTSETCEPLPNDLSTINDIDDSSDFTSNNQSIIGISNNSDLMDLCEMDKICEKNLNTENFNQLELHPNNNETYDYYSTFT